LSSEAEDTALCTTLVYIALHRAVVRHAIGVGVPITTAITSTAAALRVRPTHTAGRVG
jgi:hypothetical protein